MSTSFPGALDSYTTKVDGVGNPIMAAHVNNLQDAVVAIETFLRSYRFETNLLACSLCHDESWLGGTSFADLADDSYGPTLWTILNDANAPDVAGATTGATIPQTRYLEITLDATTRVGAVQFVGAELTKTYRGAVVSLSADLWATGITAVRMAVAYWGATPDAVTSDIVGTWAANPTLATNWAFIGTPADITITSTQTRYSVQNLTIPTSARNLAVFIWTPNQEASTDVLNIARVKLEPGAAATAFIGRAPGDELRLIEYFYTKSYAIGTTPGANVSASLCMAEGYTTQFGSCNNTTFSVRMRTTPTVTLYSKLGTASKISDTALADIGTTVTVGNTSDKLFTVVNDSGSGLTSGNKYFFHYVADARL